MCTVSWTAARDGYDLFFNRDELNTRLAEVAPVVARRDDVAYIAPRDGQHGGTWLLVNEFGLTICLLNDYRATWRPAASQTRFSRGHLVSACAAATNHAEVLAALHAQPLAATSAFQLVVLSPAEGPLVLHWQGGQLERHDAAGAVPPLSSSSFATGEVVAQRTARFAAFVRSVARPEKTELAAYHRQHDPAAGAHSVLMHRPDAATRSVIHVAVTPRRVRLVYEPVRWTPQGPAMPATRQMTLPRRSRTTLAA